MCTVRCGRGGVLPIKKRFWQTPLIIVEVKGDVNIFLKNTVNIVKFTIKKKKNMYGKININVVVVILYFVIMYVKNVKSCGPSWQKNKVFSNLITITHAQLGPPKIWSLE